MLRKAIISVGACLSLFLLWFAVYNYRQAVPIAEETLRGLALSITAAVENLAIHDPTLAELAKFHPGDVAYFALLDRHGIYRFHSNPDLIGTSATDSEAFSVSGQPVSSEERVTLGTGERAYQFTSPIYLPHEALQLRLALHTFRSDAAIRTARLNVTILLGLLVAGWSLTATLLRYVRREERLHLEMARRESLAKLGEMGAMLAHEIRNPLSGIKGFAQVIAKRPTEPRNSGFAQNIVTESVRLENLISDLLTYASRDPSAMSAVALPDLISHAVSILAPEALELGVEIVSACPEALQVYGNRDRLEQVLLNLGKNSLQAMPNGGILRISARVAGNRATITVEDTGSGIFDRDLPRIFDPFFTTKARGTGLGLALCRKIAEEHSGTIDVMSTVDQGTTATLTLPLAKR